MFEFAKDELAKFLADIPFYKNDKCFCFGKTLSEAGEIFRRLMQEGSETDAVGVACEENGRNRKAAV